MRITFVTSKINLERAGGSVPDLDLKARDMQERGADVRVLTIFSEYNLLPKDLPYRVIEEYTPHKSLPRLQARVFSLLKKYGADTDVFHVEGQFAYGAAFYRFLGGKPIVAFYNREMLVWEKDGLRRTIRRMVEKLLYHLLVPSIDHLIFTTPQLARCYQVFGLSVPSAKISILLDFFDPDSIRKRAAYSSHYASGTLRLFASGRMIPEKGFDLLIEALALLPKQTRESLSIVIGGNGSEREALMRLAQNRGLDISFPGWVSKDEFWKRFANADIFVLPHWRIEQPSVVVMEALSLGIPTVAPGGGGVEWMARDAVATFEDGNARSLSETLAEITASPEKRRRLAEACRRRVKEIDHATGAPTLWAMFERAAFLSQSRELYTDNYAT
jgi:glycosyltransferase involved in cell wall biosynthesis